MKMFEGKNFFVYGRGVSGKAAYRAIKKRGGRVKIYSDMYGTFRAPREQKYDAAIISPGIRQDHGVYAYCADRRIQTMGEAELGFRLASSDIVGVTGTNGKTTVTMLIADMIGGVACGNIGYPISAAVDREHGALVCELSSFQLRDAHISPKVAVITNIAEDHIDVHGSAEEYYRCKCNIASGMKGGYLVLGEDIKLGALKTLDTDAQIIRCSSTAAVDGAYIEDGYFKFFGERVCPVEYLRLPGSHNIKNALCALAAAKCMGAGNGEILRAMSRSSLSPHRIERVGKACGKLWIDDSKGTNVSATLAAVAATAGDICLIAGGRDKALDFCELFALLPDRVKSVIVIGESADGMLAAADKCGYGNAVKADGMRAAVELASHTKADTVLLSPACASFDGYKNYKKRGEAFKACVKALKRK